MSVCFDTIEKKYQLRYAAGIYWLLDMDQEGVPYKKPLPLNETGAAIFRMFQEGMDKDEIAEKMSRQYDVPIEETKQDIQFFFKQLEVLQ